MSASLPQVLAQIDAKKATEAQQKNQAAQVLLQKLIQLKCIEIDGRSLTVRIPPSSSNCNYKGKEHPVMPILSYILNSLQIDTIYWGSPIEDSAKKLNEVLKTNRTVLGLYFDSHHFLDDMALCYITEALTNNSTLKKLSIRQSQPSLYPHYVAGRYKSELAIQRIADLLLLNRSIQEVVFDDFAEFYTDNSAIAVIRSFLTNPILNSFSIGVGAYKLQRTKLSGDICSALRNISMTKDLILPVVMGDGSQKSLGSFIKQAQSGQCAWMQTLADLVNKYNKDVSEHVEQTIVSAIQERINNSASSAYKAYELSQSAEYWLPSANLNVNTTAANASSAASAHTSVVAPVVETISVSSSAAQSVSTTINGGNAASIASPLKK